MSKIYSDQFAGGAGLSSARTDGRATLAEALRDVADDLAAVTGIAELITTADAANTAAADAVAPVVVDAVATAVADAAAAVTADSVATAVADVSATAAADAVATAVTDVVQEYGVVDGLVVGAPTTPSSQAADPGGVTAWNVNIAAGFNFANAVGTYTAAQVDFDVSSGVKILEIGQAMYAWLVCAEAAGVVSFEEVLGTAAALGLETIPTDGDITTAIGHARWHKLALLHASRTGDVVVATTENFSYATRWGGGATALANDLKAKYNAAVTLLNELKGDLGEARSLANDLKTKYNAAVTLLNEVKATANGATALANDVKTQYNANVTLANELKGIIAALVSLANDLKSKHGGTVTLANRIKAAVNSPTDPAAPTLKTTKG